MFTSAERRVPSNARVIASGRTYAAASVGALKKSTVAGVARNATRPLEDAATKGPRRWVRTAYVDSAEVCLNVSRSLHDARLRAFRSFC